MDCKITENYFKEKARMTNHCSIKCEDCPMFKTGIECDDLETKHSKSAVQVVQKWSDEHPIKTYRDDFREKFPNCEIEIENLEWCDFYANGKARDDCERLACEDCWNQPFPETTKDNISQTKTKEKVKSKNKMTLLNSLSSYELAKMLFANGYSCEQCIQRNFYNCDHECVLNIADWLESKAD